MSSVTQLSLEPVQPYANDGHDSDLFARPARLHEVDLDNGRERFTRDDPKKSLSERLMRVWAERGDYSELSEDRILHPPMQDQAPVHADEDPRPGVDDIRTLQETMLQSLTLARSELSTALDLLSVLSAPRDPPDVDVASLPLPQQTLTTVPTAPPPRPSIDPAQNPLAALPLATSLDAISTTARAFFSASEELVPLSEEELAVLAASSATPDEATRPRPRARRAPAPDPWPTILRLHQEGAYTLVPLGATKGASLAAGKGESRTARAVGVFYGAQEAQGMWRRGAVAHVGEVLEDKAAARAGRRLVVEVDLGGSDGKVRRERVVWDDGDESSGPRELQDTDQAEESLRVDRILRARRRSAFAEELFAQLTSESRMDGALRADVNLGSRSEGDSVALSGSGWSLRITMTTKPEAPTSTHSTASTVSALLRLLFVQEYAHRRRVPPPSAAMPLLAIMAAYLGHVQRVRALREALHRLEEQAEARGVSATVELDGREEEDGSSEGGHQRAASVLGVLNGAAVLGGRATLRVGASTVFTVLYSSPLPPSPTSAAGGATPGLPAPLTTQQPTLTLHVPGRAAPLSLPSLRHLKTFLAEQVERACKADKARAVAREKGELTQ